MASSGLAPVCVPCWAPHVCCFTPAKIPTPAPLPQPARLRHHPVPEDRRLEQLAPRPPRWIPESWERILGEIHISVRSLLPFIAEQSSSEVYMGLTPMGVHGSLLPHTATALSFTGLPCTILTQEVHHPMWFAILLLHEFEFVGAIRLLWPSKTELTKNGIQPRNTHLEGKLRQQAMKGLVRHALEESDFIHRGALSVVETEADLNL